MSPPFKSSWTVRHALTVDVEEWFHGLSSTGANPELWHRFERRIGVGMDVLLHMLHTRCVKCTAFVVGDVAAESPQVVRRLVEEGHRIGCHGNVHGSVERMTPMHFELDVTSNIKAIRSAIGESVPILGFRAPAFSMSRSTEWAIPILLRLGLRYDSSTVAMRTPLYGDRHMPNFPYHVQCGRETFVRIPIPVARVGPIKVPVIGGFFLRALPTYLVVRLIKGFEANGHSVVVYTHPWEYDTNHPFVPGSVRERYSHYFGMGLVQAKLQALLREFEFGPIEDVFSDILSMS